MNSIVFHIVQEAVSFFKLFPFFASGVFED